MIIDGAFVPKSISKFHRRLRLAIPVVNNVHGCVGCPFGVVQFAEEEEDGCVESTSG